MGSIISKSVVNHKRANKTPMPVAYENEENHEKNEETQEKSEENTRTLLANSTKPPNQKKKILV